MLKNKKTKPHRKITLYVCSGCDDCHQATAFLQGWANERSNIQLVIVPIGGQPQEIIRLGINHTPALVVDDKLLAQKISVDSLTEYLRHA